MNYSPRLRVATTSAAGVVKKAATIEAEASDQISNTLGGTVLDTLPPLGGALYATDGAAIKNALTTVTDRLNKMNARLEDMIAKQKTAGIQA